MFRARCLQFKYRVSSKSCFHFLIKQMTSSTLQQESREALAFERARLLAHVLKCAPSLALQMVSKQQSLLKDWNHVEETFAFLREKLALTDIVKNYDILTLTKGRVEERYIVLQEIGVTNIAAEDIVRYPITVSSTPAQLQFANYVPRGWDVAGEMVVQLQCDKKLTDVIMGKLLQQNYRTKMSIKCIKSNILVDYLSWRLECLPEKILPLLKKHHRINHKSFKHLQATLNLIIDEFKYSNEHIRSHFYILSANPENLQTLLNNPALTELDIRKLFLTAPRVMLCQNVEKIFQILQLHEISAKQIHFCKKILTLSPEKLQKRLESVQAMPELWAMKSCDRFLCLVYTSENAKKQLETLKQAGHFAISLDMLTKNRSAEFIITGHDKCHGRECLSYFSKFFDKSRSEVKKKLHSHPNKSRISFINSQKILEEFLNRGVSKTQLWNSLFIVLYDYDLIVEYFDGLRDRLELQPFERWENQPLLLDLIVYFIERELRFSGAGVFCTAASHGKNVVQDVSDVTQNDDSECLENGYS